MKCPKCGEEMEEGFMSVPVGLSMARWNIERNKGNPYIGEVVAVPNLWGELDMAGGRCRTCRLLALPY
jgi:hypothetical protein